MHIMIDLETMGRAPNAAIVSIGAVAFNKDGLHKEFYRNVDLQSCLDYGLTITGDTVYWWMKQKEDARRALEVNKHDLFDALDSFEGYISSFSGKYAIEGIWGNGPSFDNVILANAYNAIKVLNQPWSYRQDRCFMTMKDFLPEVAIADEGTAHNALEDAKWQARYLIEAGYFKKWNQDMG